VFKNLKVKIFADVSSENEILKYCEEDHIKGFTTNPSLLKKAGINDYKAFAIKATNISNDKSISFEVVSDNDIDIKNEAYKIANWGQNVFVKIPFLKTDGTDNINIIKALSDDGIKLNITAVFTTNQVQKIANAVNKETKVIVSIFAGRIADTGIDPKPIMVEAKNITHCLPKCEVLWASSREIFNVIDANQCNCDIITLTPDLLNKFKLWGIDLNEYSRQTAEMFYNDAKSANLCID
jgi:transaldolase